MRRWMRDEVRKLVAAERKAFLLFPLAVLVIATATHELFHILVLEWVDCAYTVSAELSTAVIRFTVEPLCQLAREHSASLLMAGDLGNLAVSIVVLSGASVMRVRAETRQQYLHSFYLSVIGLGILFAVGLSFVTGGDGDWRSLAAVLNLEPGTAWLLPVGIGVFALVTLHFWIDAEATQKEYREDLKGDAPYQHRSEGGVTVHLTAADVEDEVDQSMQYLLAGDVDTVLERLEDADRLQIDTLIAREKTGENREPVLTYLEELRDAASSDQGEVPEVCEDEVDDSDAENTDQGVRRDLGASSGAAETDEEERSEHEDA